MASIKDLQPAVVWNNFYQLTQIPRPSGHEEKVSKYLYDWALAHGLDAERDKVGNVIIRKPATKGYEDRKGVILQG
ncbi:MAG: cytosol nonspecific dipeptidase, partial [Bacteroidales bacterium]|nr:cytosol nonspecific dipeptidase [Bacteroidales bacterium]